MTVAAANFVESAGPAAAIDITLPVIDKDAVSRLVSGRILFDHGLPAENVTLRLYRRGFGGAEGASMLVETTTGAHGLYSLPYDSENTANLEIRAVSGDKEVPLTKIVRSAGEKEVLNLVAPSAVQQPDAEFGRLAVDLAPHVGEALKGLAAAQGERGPARPVAAARGLGLGRAHPGDGVDRGQAERGGGNGAARGCALCGAARGAACGQAAACTGEPHRADQALTNAQAANIVKLPQETIDGFKVAFDDVSPEYPPGGPDARLERDVRRHAREAEPRRRPAEDVRQDLPRPPRGCGLAVGEGRSGRAGRHRCLR